MYMYNVQFILYEFIPVCEDSKVNWTDSNHPQKKNRLCKLKQKLINLVVVIGAYIK